MILCGKPRGLKLLFRCQQLGEPLPPTPLSPPCTPRTVAATALTGALMRPELIGCCLTLPCQDATEGLRDSMQGLRYVLRL